MKTPFVLDPPTVRSTMLSADVIQLTGLQPGDTGMNGHDRLLKESVSMDLWSMFCIVL